MNIQINGSELLLALTGAAKVLTARSTLAILSCVRFAVVDNQAQMQATDLDATVIYTFDDARVINRQGSLLVNLKDLQRLVKGAARDRIGLCDIKAGQAEITLAGELGQRTHFVHAYSDDWPETGAEVPVDSADPRFLETLRQVQPFASTDITRLVLNGAAIQRHGDQRVLVTTDGHRLCASRPLPLPLERDLIVPVHKFALWNKLGPDSAVGADKRHFRLVSGPWSFTLKQIEGTFPKWQQVIPGFQDPKAFTVDPLDLPALEEAIRTLPSPESVLPDKHDALIFREQDGWLCLEIVNAETGGQQRVLSRSPADPGVWTVLNRGYFLEAVRAGFLRWRMEDALHPVHSETEDGALHVQMPLRTEASAKFPVPEKPKMETIVSKSVPVSDASDLSDVSDQPATSQPITPKEPNPMPITAQEYDPTDADEADESPASNVVPFPTPEAVHQPESLDDLLVMLQDARNQLRDLNTRLSEIAAFVRTQKRQEKQLRAELATARNVLVKLRDIAA